MRARPHQQRRRTRSGGRLAALATPVLLALLLGGCAWAGDDGTIPMNPLSPVPGTPAAAADRLWDAVFPIAVAVGIFVQVLVVYAVWRFRARPSDTNVPRQVAGNTRIEVLWTAVPAIILVGVAIPTVGTIFELASGDPDALNVRVIAKQYWWEFQYEDPEQGGVVTANQLHIPTGRDIHLDMQSVAVNQTYRPSDVPEGEEPRGAVAQGVIHSFWVPELAPTADIVPGHTRTLNLNATEEGLYEGHCKEFCGLSHANMHFSVVAESPEEFDAFIAAQQEPAEVVDAGLAQTGQELFTSRQCVGCHAINGYPEGGDPAAEPVPYEAQARVGPDLTHFNEREIFAGILPNTDEQLAAWLANPQAEKPGAQMPNLGLGEEEIAALTAYLRTLD